MKIFIYSGTHWDREWYEPFQGFRYRLVKMVDGLLDGLENNLDYGTFHFDGQTVVLEDYLQIRPENRGRLEKQIKAGRIVIGPWYDMPDEFLLSGESLVRNLRLGGKIAREQYGVEPSKSGYICDIFGHIAQMPQIFAGFGISHSVLGRGTNEHTTPMHFLWRSPDGSAVTVYKLADKTGYGDLWRVFEFSDESITDAEIDEKLKAYFDPLIKRANLPIITAFDAQDHHVFRSPRRIIESIHRLYPDSEVLHTDIQKMFDAEDACPGKLPEREGELNETAKLPGCYIHLITNTLSSRYPVKRYNDLMQTELEKRLAPLYALRLTKDAPGFLRQAEKYLLLNHPHDSICGCSIDQVHRDMMYRFDQVRLISEQVEKTFYTELSAGKGEKKILRVHNPLPYAYKGQVELHIDFEPEFPSYCEPFDYEPIAAFKLYDADGDEVPYGFVDKDGKGRYTVAAELELIPCGVTELEVRPFEMPTRYPERLEGTAVSAKGEKVALEINADGTLNITDLVTAERYENLLTLMDDGEIGDGWFHCNPAADVCVTSTRADISRVENNRERVTFRVRRHMALPEAMDRSAGIHRSEKTVDFVVDNFVTVTRTGRAVSVRTVIDNNAKDHRLRTRLPRVCGGKSYFVNQAYSTVTRACGDKPETADWKEYGCVEKQTGGIVAKRYGRRGLAFISACGIHECGVWENGDMDITMFRCFSKTVFTDGEPDGELQERLEFEYLLMPITEADSFASLQRVQDFLQVKPVCVTASADAAVRHEPGLIVEGEHIVYTTAAPLEDETAEVRIYNDSDVASEARIKLPAYAKVAALTELDGRTRTALTVTDGAVSLTLSPWKIATVKIK